MNLPRAGRRSRSTATRCSAASPPRIRPTTSSRTTARSHTYRSPAGFGIRLDGGSAYGGAVITPYYDSLLVKITAWGRDFRHACQRMDRALREFRIRGVKTNIPFLENVVNHPDFQAGRRHHALARRDARAVPLHAAPRPRHQAADLSRRRDRERQSRPSRASRAPQRIRPAAGAAARSPPRRRDGTRQLAAASWAPRASPSGPRTQKRLLITDTTFRDAHQSLLATRVRTYDMLAHRELRLAPAARPLQPGNVGRRHLRRDHALPPRGSLGSACGACARRFRTSASRCCCARRTPSATRPIPTTWSPSSSTRRRRRASTSSASSTRSTGCRT